MFSALSLAVYFIDVLETHEKATFMSIETTTKMIMKPLLYLSVSRCVVSGRFASC